MASLSKNYIAGFLQTDGSFSLDFKEDSSMTIKYRCLPVVSFSQKKDRISILENIQLWLKAKNIASRIEGIKSTSNRAPRLRIAGIDPVRNFLFEFQSCLEEQLTGVKRFDYMIMKSIFEIIDALQQNTVEGRKKIIDLKLSFHKPPLPYPEDLRTRFKRCKLKDPEIKPIPPSNRFSQDKWEDKHNIPLKSTLKSAESFVNRANQDFLACCVRVLENYENKEPSFLQPDFISGVIDGNGYISPPNQSFTLKISMPTGSESSLLAFAHYFQDSDPSFFSTNGGQLYSCKTAQKQAVIEHNKKSPFRFKVVPE